MNDNTNRKALIHAASALLRKRGYAGVGLAEILAETGLPKGSLYHHFPGGKEQLAGEATRWAGHKIAELIDATFGEADSFAAGSLALCRAIARLSRESGRILGCPVLSVAQAGIEKPELHGVAATVLAEWISRIEGHARRLDQIDPHTDAERLLIGLQGAWAVALARQDASAFETLEKSLC
ncbi:TetR/AcrR family transcriptional regulator [Rhizobium aegyptiacum]|uniref:TetR/AcrR family transcriptional regulator n=1 Tax=Rhizobium aegyptiacum TaxID=1764550 RepID=UPI0007E56DDE|nr:TetR/AcrR family transcriptional regulator [Rhizobium aegyptiacum]